MADRIPEGLVQVLLSFLSFHVPALRPALEREPIIIVQDGKPIEKVSIIPKRSS